MNELAEEVREPLIAAADVTLREWAGTEALVAAVDREAPAGTAGEVAAVLRLVSGAGGALVVSVPKQTAGALARRILTGVTAEPDEELVRDCVGEMGNVIAGQAKALLAATPSHLAFATPVVLPGDDPRTRPGADAACLVIRFTTDVGPFTIQFFVNLR